LFREAEAGDRGELLWIREPTDYFVVLGSSRPAQGDVDLGACRALNIPVIRRFSGGGTVLQGPGSLCFSVLLRHENRPEVARGVHDTDRYVLLRMIQALTPWTADVEIAGVCDLVIGGRKIAGHAQRRGRSFTLYHGSILNDLDLELMAGLLRIPDRRPDYRGDRRHLDFVRNLHIPKSDLVESIRKAWSAEGPADPPSEQMVYSLVSERYGNDDWTFRF
jgi:lipoate-protein ligase A